MVFFSKGFDIIDIDIQDFKLLQRAAQGGIIDLETVKEQVQMQERTKILKRHCYGIWQGKTTRKWYTYLPAPEKKTGRVQKERNTKEEIEDVIVEYYLSQEASKDSSGQCESDSDTSILTIESLFPRWLQYKEDKDAAGSYLRKLYLHWKKYYLGDDIIKRDIRTLTSLELEIWSYQLIKRNGFTSKEYYNVSVIIRQILEFAVSMNYISESPFMVKIDPKHFRKIQKKPDETQVFLINEQPLLEKACWDRYEKLPMSVSSLSIPLFLRTGIRVGEMVALKEEDISGDFLHIHREEVENVLLEEVGGELKPVRHGFKVVDHTKTDAGDRYVYLTPEAKHILDCIIKSNRIYKNYDEGFLFVKGSKRILANSVLKRLYSICEYADIPKKSTHKTRKTFISGLIDGGVNINTIRKTVGHVKEETTYSNYCFDRRPQDIIEEQFDEILDGANQNQSNPIKN